MAKLSTQDRKNLDKSQFAIPERAPGSGSYPINDPSHARDALARSSGKPEEGRVRAAVRRKFPGMDVADAAPPRKTAAKVSTSENPNSVKARVSAAVKKVK